jgi:DNA-binding NtrC family response regulator
LEILIVDSDLRMADKIARHLKAWGHQSERLSFGRKALSRVRNKLFDLVLLDVFLPDMQASELIPQIKQIRPAVRIVTMTGYNSRELELKIRRQGILYYMIKPLEESYLKSILDYISSKKGGD